MAGPPRRVSSLLACFGLVVLAGCSPPQRDSPPPAPAALRLERTLGDVRELPLTPGGTLQLEIALATGEYLALHIEQVGIDAEVIFHHPDGHQLLFIDNWSGADGSRGPEGVHWVAATAGVYRVDVHGRESSSSGTVQVTVEALRLATEVDRRRAAAEEALQTGDLRYKSVEADSWPQALESYQQALAAFRELNDLHRQADTHFRLAEAHYGLGDYDLALDHYGLALELYESLGDQRQQALTRLHRGYLLYNLDRMTDALEDYQRTLPLWRQTGDRKGEGLTLIEIGATLRYLGDSHAALLADDQALEIWQRLGDRRWQATTLHNRGRLYAALGKSEQALADLQRSLALRRQLTQRTGVARTLNALGLVYAQRGEPERALRCFQQAIAVSLRAESSIQAINLAGSAQARLDLGEPQQALADLDHAEAIFQAKRDRAWLAKVQETRAWVLIAQDQPAEALADFESALAQFTELRDRAGAAEARLGMATALRAQGELAAARRQVESAIEAVEDLRLRAATGDELRAFFLASKQRYYDLHVDILMELHRQAPAAGYDAAALASSERARARSLLDTLAAGDSRHTDADPALATLATDLERRINVQEMVLISLGASPFPDPARLAAVEREQRDLLRQYQRVGEQLRAASPRYAALTRPQTLDAAAIRQLLDPDTLLLEYRLGEERSFLWAVTSRGLASFELPPRAQVEAQARQAYELVVANQRRSRQRCELLLDELSRTLLDPAADLLASHRRLAIVADGALRVPSWLAITSPSPPCPHPEPKVSRWWQATSWPACPPPPSSVSSAVRCRTAGPRPARWPWWRTRCSAPATPACHPPPHPPPRPTNGSPTAPRRPRPSSTSYPPSSASPPSASQPAGTCSPPAP